MGFRVWGLRVLGLGFQVSGLGFRVLGFGAMETTQDLGAPRRKWARVRDLEGSVFSKIGAPLWGAGIFGKSYLGTYKGCLYFLTLTSSYRRSKN